MSYADPSSLITPQVVDLSERVDSRLKRMVATSLAVHAVLVLGLMSVRVAPTIQPPLAAYQVDLITLPEPEVASSVKEPTPVQRATVPPPSKSQTKPNAAPPPPVTKAETPVKETPSPIPDATAPPTPAVTKPEAPVKETPSPIPNVTTPSTPAVTKPEAPVKEMPSPIPNVTTPSTPAVTKPEPATAPAPQVVEPMQTEEVTQSIVDAVESVALPHSRAMGPMEKSAALPQRSIDSTREELEDQKIALPVVPQSPKISKRQSVSKGGRGRAAAPSRQSLADSLQQAIQSVAVPRQPSVSRSSPSSPVESQTNPRPSQSPQKITPKSGIRTPGQAPQLAKVLPVPESTDEQSQPRSKKRVADSLKQIAQSVVIPEMRKSKRPHTQRTLAVPVPAQPDRDTPPKPRKKLKGIVIPSEAPTLADVEVPQVRKTRQRESATDVSSPVSPTRSDQNIAKLMIPEIRVSEPHHILSKPTERGIQNTTTALQVSGSTPEGNAYWGRVWSKIDREWIAPAVEVHSGQPLRVVLGFRLERSGTVKHLKIEQSSGNEYYDVAAKRAVLNAVPLPAFSSDMPEPSYDVLFQFTVNVDS